MMMASHYAAYGLALRSAFELPGMGATTTQGLPTLALELVTPAELTASWSTPDGPPLWRGRLGDGATLTIERGTDGDLLFTHGDLARHRLDPSGHVLECAPRRPGLDWQRVLLAKVLSSISVMRGYEALHASAVESPWGVLAIAAPSGMGKSTLALVLMQRGWPLVTDDVLALTTDAEGVHAYPGTPHMNVAPGSSDRIPLRDIGSSLAVLHSERWVAAHEVVSEPRPVHAVCLLERRRCMPLELRTLPANPLPLVPYMLGLPGDLERERHRFELYADLVASVTFMRLVGDLDVGAAQLADTIEASLSDHSSALLVGGSA